MTTTPASTRTHRHATTTRSATPTVDQNDHVAAAQYLMKHAGTTALPVLNGQRSDQPIGCITETDIADAIADGTDVNQTRVRDLLVHNHAPSVRTPASRAS